MQTQQLLEDYGAMKLLGKQISVKIVTKFNLRVLIPQNFPGGIPPDPLEG